jgi:hypothetical protein
MVIIQKLQYLKEEVKENIIELVEDLKDGLINIINQNQKEKIIIFEEGFINDDFLVSGNRNETII